MPFSVEESSKGCLRMLLEGLDAALDIPQSFGSDS